MSESIHDGTAEGWALSVVPPRPALMPLELADHLPCTFGEREGVAWSSRQYTLSDSLTNCFPKPLFSPVCGSELLLVAKQPTSSSRPQHLSEG